jgi:nucleoid-associated protein YejK
LDDDTDNNAKADDPELLRPLSDYTVEEILDKQQNGEYEQLVAHGFIHYVDPRSRWPL